MARVIFLMAFSLVSCIAPFAYSSAMIPREVLFGNPGKTAPMISPDGKTLGFLAPDQKNVMNVWIKDLGRSEETLITSDEHGIQSFLWRYDSKAILYLQDHDGDENYHLYQTDLVTKQTRDLTPFDGARAKIVAYKSTFPDEILLQINLRNRSIFDAYRVNLKTGTCELELEDTYRVLKWKADSNLQIRASIAYDPDGNIIVRVRDDVTSPWCELMRWGPEESGDILSFSADGRFLNMISSVGANTERLVQVDLNDGSLQTLAQDLQYDLSDSAITGHPISQEIQAIRINRARPEWIVLDPSVQTDFAVLERKDMTMSIVSRDLQDKHWIIGYRSDCIPARFYLYDRTSQKTQFLFSTRPELERYDLCPMMPISFQARDGMKLYGYLTLPKGKEPKNLPTVLCVHGGPWLRDSWQYSPDVQLLANRGYAVLQINFRGSTGYGKQYLNAGNHEWGGKMQTDLLDGKQWLIDQNIADSKKIAIYGMSYGGYATLVGLTFTPEEFCCGIDLFGPSNLVSLLETVPPYWSSRLPKFYVRVGNLQTEREFLESRSPLFKADQICRPLLIIQGANDARVKQSESDQIVSAIRKNGKTVEYIVIPDEGHGLMRPSNVLKFTAIAEEFLHKHLNNSE